jgi:CcmD family protein
MGNTIYLFSAFSITWIVIFMYVFSILRRQKSLENQLEKISELLEKVQKT